LRLLRQKTGSPDGDGPRVCILIRQARKEAGLSQEQMAVRLGLSRGGYVAYEQHREPSSERRRQIATALGKPLDYFEPIGASGEEAQDLVAQIREILDRLERLESSRTPRED
jgi:transcriptional regulator with XRE-family HTH domain